MQDVFICSEAEAMTGDEEVIWIFTSFQRSP